MKCHTLREHPSWTHSFLKRCLHTWSVSVCPSCREWPGGDSNARAPLAYEVRAAAVPGKMEQGWEGLFDPPTSRRSSDREMSRPSSVPVGMFTEVQETPCTYEEGSARRTSSGGLQNSAIPGQAALAPLLPEVCLAAVTAANVTPVCSLIVFESITLFSPRSA